MHSSTSASTQPSTARTTGSGTGTGTAQDRQTVRRLRAVPAVADPVYLAGAVAVHVQSVDAVAIAGVRALLHGHPRIRVVGATEVGSASVVIHIAEQLSTGELQHLRRQVGAHAPGAGPSVLAITNGFANDDLLAALDAGVVGMVRRSDAGRAQIVSAVLALADGAVLLPPRLQSLLVQHLRRVRTEVLDPNGLTLSGLTSRERDVLRLVAEGLDTDEIALRLSFSPRTVKYVLTHVMTRYGLRSRTHAVAYAVRVGAI